MNAETIETCAPFRRDDRLNPKGDYDFLFLKLETDTTTTPPTITGAEWRLVSSRKRAPDVVLDQSQIADILITFFTQNSRRVIQKKAAPSQN